MSDTYYGLSKMEYNLMKYFWNNNGPVSFSEVEKYCNTELHYNWAQPTLHTYLTRLTKKGILHSEGKGYKCKRSYYPELTEQELAHKYATDFVDNTFNGSISDLLVSLTYNTKLSESDIEELKNIINKKYNGIHTYDFKNDLNLWIEYIGNPDRIAPPIDVKFINPSIDDIYFLIKKSFKIDHNI